MGVVWHAHDEVLDRDVAVPADWDERDDPLRRNEATTW
jgi:hypothetical protein